ncbi:MAG: helix-turn-helix domain-containing protein [Acidimicrobiia bacterium]|nr:helix-turn-helix domain-containing protein [Acidimicrobiia bacterium]
MLNDKQVYTVDEVAVILGVSRNTAYEGIKTNSIPHLKLGRRIVVPAIALNALLSGTTDQV